MNDLGRIACAIGTSGKKGSEMIETRRRISDGKMESFEIYIFVILIS